jgi:hypothetical protein
MLLRKPFIALDELRKIGHKRISGRQVGVGKIWHHGIAEEMLERVPREEACIYERRRV